MGSWNYTENCEAVLTQHRIH